MKTTRRRSPLICWIGRTIISGLVSVIYRVRVRGRENAPATGPFLLVGNHEHVLDPIALQRFFRPWIHWVAKAELFRGRLLGSFLRGLGVVAFDREQLDMAAMRSIIGLIRNGEAVGIFPQGRRIDRNERTTIRPKAATAHLARRFDLPLVPVAIEDGFHFFRRTKIYIGRPFMLGELGEGDDLALTEQIMERIYGLIPTEERCV